MWCWVQQHPHYLRIHKKCEFPGPSPDLLTERAWGRSPVSYASASSRGGPDARCCTRWARGPKLATKSPVYSRVCLGGTHSVGFHKHIRTCSHHSRIIQSSSAVVCYNSHRKLLQTRTGSGMEQWDRAEDGALSPPHGFGVAFCGSFALHPTGALISALPEPALSLPVDSERYDHHPRCRLSAKLGQSRCLVLVSRGPCPFPPKAQVRRTIAVARGDKAL